jgi:hypothetical protein
MEVSTQFYTPDNLCPQEETYLIEDCIDSRTVLNVLKKNIQIYCLGIELCLSSSLFYLCYMCMNVYMYMFV